MVPKMSIFKKIFYLNPFMAPFLGGSAIILLAMVLFNLQPDSPELILGVVTYTIVWLATHLFMVYEGWMGD